ncbi:MAG: hypothetical protein R3F30_00710 [Planctomycetota bacterium]
MRPSSFLDPATYRRIRRKHDWRPIKVTLQTSGAMLAWWFPVDVIGVCCSEMPEFMRVAFLIATLGSLAGILVSHVWRLRHDWIIALLTLFPAFWLGVALVNVIGIPFHVMIGGSLAT